MKFDPIELFLEKSELLCFVEVYKNFMSLVFEKLIWRNLHDHILVKYVVNTFLDAARSPYVHDILLFGLKLENFDAIELFYVLKSNNFVVETCRHLV